MLPGKSLQFFPQKLVILPVTFSSLKIGRAPKGNSSSNHQFSGAKMLVVLEGSPFKPVGMWLSVSNCLTRLEGFSNDWVVVSNIFYFHPYLGTWSSLTNIFKMGWNHHLDDFWPASWEKRFLRFLLQAIVMTLMRHFNRGLKMMFPGLIITTSAEVTLNVGFGKGIPPKSP